MGRLKMDYYINVKPRTGSKYARGNEVVSAGFRKGTFYVEGDISKVLSQSEIERVYVIKDQTYQLVTIDTFLQITRARRA